MARSIGRGGLDTRYRNLVKEFGHDSSVVQAAQKFIEYRINKKHLIYDDKGNLTGISQSKETKKALEGHKWTAFEEWVPTKKALYEREMNAVVAADTYGPQLITSDTKYKDVIKDPKAEAYLKSKAEFTSQLLKDNGDIIDNLYKAADDDKFSKQYVAKSMKEKLHDEPYLAYDLQWLADANWVVNEWYIEKATRAEDEDF
jgi:hypothetical protein